MSEIEYEIKFFRKLGLLDVYVKDVKDPKNSRHYSVDLKRMREQIPGLRVARNVLSELLSEINSYLKEAER